MSHITQKGEIVNICRDNVGNAMEILYRHPNYGLISIQHRELSVDHLIRLGICIKDAEQMGKKPITKFVFK